MKMQLYALGAVLLLLGMANWSHAQESSDGKKYDFGNFSSETLTGKAWQALNSKDFEAVMVYTNKCKDMFLDKAIEQQGSLAAPAPKDQAFTYWALNDVGTCLFIQGQAFEAMGQPDKAVEAYKLLVEKLSYAQCWDTQGWFWRPGDAAKQKLTALEFQAAQSK